MPRRIKKVSRRSRLTKSALQKTPPAQDEPTRRKKVQPPAASQTMAAALISPSENFLNAIYNGMIEGVLAVNVDTRHIVYWNRAAEALFGYAREEVLEHTTEFLYADSEAFQRLYEQSTPTIQEHGYWRGETRFQRRDGSSFWGEVTFTTFLQTGSKDAYAVVVIRDMTERKQAEEALRQSEERFRQAFDHAAIGKALVMPNGKWLLVNRCLCEITGYAEEELLATDWQSITHPDDIEADLAQAHRLLAGEIDRYTLEKRYLHKQGGSVWVLLSVALVRDPDDQPLYFIAEMQDRTEQKQLEIQLRDRERLAIMGTTVAKIAHEIGNPLNGMMTTLQILEQDLVSQQLAPNDNLLEAVHDLKHETDRLRSLLQEMRIFARLPNLDLRPTNLTEVVVDVLRGQAASYLNCHVIVDQRLLVDVAPVMADQEKLTQVLLNLYNNAIEAMPRGGTLTVCVMINAGAVCLEVTDTGEGVPAGLNIFEPFVTTKGQGSGLGLSIVKQIIEAHGGTIVSMSAPGQGTTFRVVLPMRQDE